MNRLENCQSLLERTECNTQHQRHLRAESTRLFWDLLWQFIKDNAKSPEAEFMFLQENVTLRAFVLYQKYGI